MSRTISLDYDGTVHPYTDGWVGYEPADEPPIEGAAEFMTTLQAYGYRIIISSCRADCDAGKDGIVRWLDKHGLLEFVDEITNMKPPAVAYVDDRAVPFAGNWTAVLDHIQRLDTQL